VRVIVIPKGTSQDKPPSIKGLSDILKLLLENLRTKQKKGETCMEIIPRVHIVDGVDANVYILETPDHLTLIDTGLPGRLERILNYINKPGRDPSSVSSIILTHSHIDHMGNVSALKRLTGARLFVHEDDAPFVAGRKSFPLLKGLEGAILKALPSLKLEYVEPDVLLREGDEIEGFTVIHNPGHTPGSISLYSRERGVISVGDALRYIDGEIRGPPTEFTPDMDQAIRSLGKLTGMEYDIMLSGHGTPLGPHASERVREFCRSLIKTGDEA
jgi:glyoxylase-like metal-dependent hydrolase (beta-lactamase superfamily II)